MNYNHPLKGSARQNPDIDSPGPNTNTRTGNAGRIWLAAMLGFSDLSAFNAWAFSESQEAQRTRVLDPVACFWAAAFNGASEGTPAAPISIVSAVPRVFFTDNLGANKFLTRVGITCSFPLGTGGEVDDPISVRVFGVEANGVGVNVTCKPGVLTWLPVSPEAQRARGVIDGVQATLNLRYELTALAATAGNPCQVIVSAMAGPVPQDVLDRRLEASALALTGGEDEGSDSRAGKGTGAGHGRLGELFHELSAPTALGAVSSLKSAMSRGRKAIGPSAGGGPRGRS